MESSRIFESIDSKEKLTTDYMNLKNINLKNKSAVK